MAYISPDSDRSEHIPTLAPDAHHAVDWDRVRVTIRRLRPLRAIAVLSAGLFPAVVWCNQVAEPLAADENVHVGFAAAFITSLLCGFGFAAGGRIRRWVTSVVLFAAVGGTLLAEPTRHLITAWIVEAGAWI
ncbi:hypothetical protein C0216_08810 [Streptomyces globosus]|uniref:Uncharacterized protein n=1 Tax=Streptomyces globosus TaxID=68209 RepID=A0A344TY29_9ACTN|nr:hypothetical protein [Streptomyces globosus]AXE23550.1 hypothetical protein C0216_08810 [Streptomyces globosus]